MKPSLAINQSDLDNTRWDRTLGMRELLSYLRDSNLFDISYHKEKVSIAKGMRATILIYNDKRVYLDLWEYNLPTYSNKILRLDFDLIIKLQHKKMSQSHVEAVSKRKGLLKERTPEERWEFVEKIVPWTFFASRIMRPFIDKEDEIEQLPIERMGFFCGKEWWPRHKMIAKLKEDENIEYYASDQMTRDLPLNDDEYVHAMRTSKYGVVIHGRGSHMTEYKNRREIDYMILKKPILMNYKPYYYNSLEEGKHYIYIDENTDFTKLESMYNIEEIAQNGYQWYKENASPEGASKSFLQIMNDKFKEE